RRRASFRESSKRGYHRTYSASILLSRHALRKRCTLDKSVGALLTIVLRTSDRRSSGALEDATHDGRRRLMGAQVLGARQRLRRPAVHGRRYGEVVQRV